MSSLPLILGHRGASAVAPENTLAAFSRALKDNADGFEFDVRLSSDGVPVVIHDPSLKRTASLPHLVSELTSAELEKVDVGAWFDSRKSHPAAVIEASYAGVTIPTLRRIFELFSCALYVEMKCDPNHGKLLAEAVAREIHEAQVIDHVVVESFDLTAIAEVKIINRAIRTAALFEPKLQKPFSTLRPKKRIELAKRSGADEIALHHTLANTRTIDHARAEQLEVVVWTVDDVKWVRRAAENGIKALIANNPGPLVLTRNADESVVKV